MVFSSTTSHKHITIHSSLPIDGLHTEESQRVKRVHPVIN